MPNRVGRPISEKPKSNVVGVRVTPEEHVKLKAYSDQHQQTISQTVQKALNLLYEREADKT